MAKLISKEEEPKRTVVYSSALIDQMLEDRRKGYQIDMSPFFQGNVMYRDAGVSFKYTQEELEEILKCSEDCLYFVEKYCKFLNDKGRTLVNLRDYQKDILKLYSDEVWDEEIGDAIPKNRYVILLQSRQTGKCVEGCTEIELEN